MSSNYKIRKKICWIAMVSGVTVFMSGKPGRQRL